MTEWVFCLSGDVSVCKPAVTLVTTFKADHFGKNKKHTLKI